MHVRSIAAYRMQARLLHYNNIPNDIYGCMLYKQLSPRARILPALLAPIYES